MGNLKKTPLFAKVANLCEFQSVLSELKEGRPNTAGCATMFELYTTKPRKMSGVYTISGEALKGRDQIFFQATQPMTRV
jgi:hypothetical protein